MKTNDNWLIYSVISTSLLITPVLNFLVQYRSQWLPDFIASEAGIALLTIILPFLVLYSLKSKKNLLFPISKIINLQEEDISLWLNPSRKTWILIFLFGFLIDFLGILTVQPQVFGLPWIGLAKILFELWIIIFLFGYSIVVGLYIHDLAIILRLKNCCNEDRNLSFYQNNIDIFYWPIEEVRAIYYRYFKSLIIATIIYLTAVLILWVSPAGGFLAVHTNVGRLWVFPPALILIIYFIMFSFGIHSLLPKWKINSQDKLKNIFEKEINDYFVGYSDKAAESIDRLLRWRDLIENKDIKIFNFKLILATIATILAPTARILLFPSIKEAIKIMLSYYPRGG